MIPSVDKGRLIKAMANRWKNTWNLNVSIAGGCRDFTGPQASPAILKDAAIWETPAGRGLMWASIRRQTGRHGFTTGVWQWELWMAVPLKVYCAHSLKPSRSIICEISWQTHAKISTRLHLWGWRQPVGLSNVLSTFSLMEWFIWMILDETPQNTSNKER